MSHIDMYQQQLPYVSLQFNSAAKFHGANEDAWITFQFSSIITEFN